MEQAAAPARPRTTGTTAATPAAAAAAAAIIGATIFTTPTTCSPTTTTSNTRAATSIVVRVCLPLLQGLYPTLMAQGRPTGWRPDTPTPAPARDLVTCTQVPLAARGVALSPQPLGKMPRQPG